MNEPMDMLTRMTKLEAHGMLFRAEYHLWAFVPGSHFVTEHPELASAIADLQNAQRQLSREIRQAATNAQ